METQTTARLRRPITKSDIMTWKKFLGIIVLYALLIIPTVSYQGISWDEEIDMRIAQAYLSIQGFFFGLSLDLSQTRLPMISVALVYFLFGSEGLITARIVSVLVGGLTLLGVYVYGQERFDARTGLLAALLLAISPFFLSFARIAFTETDIYLACTLTWLVVFVSRTERKPTIGRAVAAGIMLGLAISTKATVLSVVPALWIVLLISGRKSEIPLQEYQSQKERVVPWHKVFYWSAWSLAVFVGGITLSAILQSGGYPGRIRLLLYAAVCLGWLLPIIWTVRNRQGRAHPAALAALLTGIGLLTFVIFPPDHLTNSAIVQSILFRGESEMSFNPAFIGELTALHLLSIFFKSTPLIGAALLAGLAASIIQWRQKYFWLPVLVSLSYLAGLLILPLGQTFYTVPILPILSILAAVHIVRLWKKHRKTAFVFLAAAALLWGVEIARSYPDYNLNGYQWLGARPLFGRSSIGYRSVVYTPADGVQQAVEWLNKNAQPGQVAQLYVDPWHIVRHYAPEPAYILTNGLEEPQNSTPDYIVIHINTVLSQGMGTDYPDVNIFQYPFDLEQLEQEYEKTFVVRRAFGLEFAQIWQRR
jgi:4-amino-4-deoxy-L-arabinose transferase-like glycosyltransferase